ncbi:hypothetical protein [Alcanivorax sediminis]|uniref:Sel1 repeat family protein n=1 Tax=Alcanivorax sediminis TaxID=2663008 RepID=A0A6N7LQC8_9GAMM|nr:hypothetical protein [Alcanivorax sediminis]MQX52212.1 hypothetical protein [Alcanivorax sediminis]
MSLQSSFLFSSLLLATFTAHAGPPSSDCGMPDIKEAGFYCLTGHCDESPAKSDYATRHRNAVMRYFGVEKRMKRDRSRALAELEQLGHEGYPQSAWFVAERYYHGLSGSLMDPNRPRCPQNPEQDRDKGYQWYEIAARNGHTTALQITLNYYRDQGVWERAEDLLKVVEGNEEQEKLLAQYYSQSAKQTGSSEELLKAAYYVLLVGDRNKSEYHQKPGLMGTFGNNFTERTSVYYLEAFADSKELIAYLKDRAHDGSSTAGWVLYHLYKNSNDSKANQYLRLSAENGFTGAIKELAGDSTDQQRHYNIMLAEYDIQAKVSVGINLTHARYGYPHDPKLGLTMLEDSVRNFVAKDNYDAVNSQENALRAAKFLGIFMSCMDARSQKALGDLCDRVKGYAYLSLNGDSSSKRRMEMLQPDMSAAELQQAKVMAATYQKKFDANFKAAEHQERANRLKSLDELTEKLAKDAEALRQRAS